MLLERKKAHCHVPPGIRDWNHLELAPVFSDHMVVQRDLPVRVWGRASPGEALTVSLGPRESRCRADAGGHWEAVIEPFSSSAPLTLTVEGDDELVEVRDVLLGEVWLCAGQSNMEFVLQDEDGGDAIVRSATHPAIRHLTIPRAQATIPLADFRARWEVCSPETAGKLSAVGYHFGLRLQRALGCPVGLIVNAHGGSVAESWVRETCLEDDPALSPILRTWERFIENYPDDPGARESIAQARFLALMRAGKIPPPWGLEPKGPAHFHRPAVLFNAMVNPLIPLSMRGVLWYQGEANAGRAHQYRKLLPALIADWRKRWNLPDLWFHLVQLPNFDAPWLAADAFAEMREAQAIVARESAFASIACTVDLGDQHEIHPAKKSGIGDRLARLALAKTYGLDIPFSGPALRSWDPATGAITFDHAGGLFAAGGEPRGFVAAGEDRRFVPVRAVMDGERVLVPGNHAAVRYAWANNPSGNLFNREGLPAFPFRTDSWPGTTCHAYEPEPY